MFLTVLDPLDTCDEIILANNYNTKLNVSSIKSKIECAFVFELDELSGVKQLHDAFFKKRDIWRYDSNVNLDKFNFRLILR